MSYGLPYTRTFLEQLQDQEVRAAYVADQVRARIAQLIRVLREQRHLTQAELAQLAKTSQNVISRFEDPDYGKMSLHSLLQIAKAFDLPIWIDIPEWKKWFELTEEFPASSSSRASFNLAELLAEKPASEAQQGGAAASAAQSVQRMLLVQNTLVASAANNFNQPEQSSGQEANLAARAVGVKQAAA